MKNLRQEFLITAMVVALFTSPASAQRSVELLNVSYDPTRELWRDINSKFVAHYQK